MHTSRAVRNLTLCRHDPYHNFWTSSELRLGSRRACAIRPCPRRSNKRARRCCARRRPRSTSLSTSRIVASPRKGALWTSPALLAVVCALAAHPRGLAQDSLSELLRPEVENDPRRALRVYVHRLRRRIGLRDVVRFANGRYVLGPMVDVDFQDVEADIRRARRAVLSEEDRCRLESYATRFSYGRPPCVARWDWFEPIEEHMRRLARDVDVILARDALLAGNVDRALTLAHRLSVDDPLDEDAQEIAIRASPGGGSCRCDFQYRRYRELLQRELDEEPSTTLRRLVLDDDRRAS